MSQTFYYNGTNITGFEVIISPEWRVEERINNVSSMRCKIVDDNGQTIECGKECYFYDDSLNILHAGILTDIDDDEEIHDTLYYDCTIEDFTKIANQPKAKIVYENKSIDYIVKDLRTRYLNNSTDSNYDFGVTEGTIETDLPVLNYIAFNYLTLSECFNKLCDFGNYIWNIDKNKKLNFYSIGYIVNTTVFDRNTTVFNNFKRKRSMQNYRNYQIVKGSPYVADLRVNEIPTPPGDGNIKTYTTKYKIAEAPKIEVSANSGATWTEASVGVLGIDSDSDFDFLWTYNSQQFSQNDSGTALNYAGGDRIRISYKPLIPLLIIYKNSGEIANRGIYEHYVENKLLQNKYDALKYAKTLIEKYAEISDSITFDLYEHTYNSMEQITINDNLRNIVNETFLVESCTWQPIDDETIIYSYKILDGAELGGWEEFLKNLIKPEKITLDDNEIVIDLKEYSDTHSHDGEYNITIYDDLLYPADDLYPADTLYPNNSSSSADSVID